MINNSKGENENGSSKIKHRKEHELGSTDGNAGKPVSGGQEGRDTQGRAHDDIERASGEATSQANPPTSTASAAHHAHPLRMKRYIQATDDAQFSLVTANSFYEVWQSAHPCLRIVPTLDGLKWILHMHYNMEERTPDAFYDLFEVFFALGHERLVSKHRKAELNILGLSPVIQHGTPEVMRYYVAAGENGLTAIQMLGMNWYLDCQCVEEIKQ